MSADALLEFKNAYHENLINLYISANCNPNKLTNALKCIFTDQDYSLIKYRAVWEHILLNSLTLIGKRVCSGTVLATQFKVKPKNPLFHYVITPTDEFYDYSKNITEAIHVEITRGEKVEYRGVLANADFKDW